MKTVLIVGVGRFGRKMIEKLNDLGYEVMAIDRDESRVNDILPLVTDAQIGDATNELFLRSLGKIGTLQLFVLKLNKVEGFAVLLGFLLQLLQLA